jgi:prepilin-type N-terminal cleavage/methylation domain-containing protein
LRQPPSSSRAFTLIETIIVAAITSVLLALAVIAVRSVRERSRHAASLANLRTHAQIFAAYANDYSDCLPYFTKVGFASTTLTGGGIQLEGVSFFDAFQTWHIALTDGYYSAPAQSCVFFPPKGPDGWGGWWPFHTSYHYPCAFIAKPAYWNETTRMGPQQYGVNRLGDVSFPSDKALIVEDAAEDDVAQPTSTATMRTSCCDGSARERLRIDTLNGYPKGDGYAFVEDGAVHYIDVPRLLHTIDGVHGRDFR